jgi:hypothetical protein
MKLKSLLCLFCAALVSLPAAAGERGPLAVVVDGVVVRPASLAVTILGSGLFLVTLPFSIPSKSTGKTADTLISYPARMTFTRPLGDLDALVGPAWASQDSRTDTSDDSKFSEVPEESPVDAKTTR